VRADSALIEVDGRKLTFRVAVFEELSGGDERVGEGIHRRAIIDLQRFAERVAHRAARPA